MKSDGYLENEKKNHSEKVITEKSRKRKLLMRLC